MKKSHHDNLVCRQKVFLHTDTCRNLMRKLPCDCISLSLVCEENPSWEPSMLVFLVSSWEGEGSLLLGVYVRSVCDLCWHLKEGNGTGTLRRMLRDDNKWIRPSPFSLHSPLKWIVVWEIRRERGGCTNAKNEKNEENKDEGRKGLNVMNENKYK